MLYKIGDVAKVLGISTNTLRYYEKRGLVNPVKNFENSYRYYDFWDINFLLDSLWFRGFEFSLEQVADMINIPSHHDISVLFCEKENDYRKKINHYKMLLERSAQHRDELSHIPAMLGECDISIRQPYICFLNRYTEDYDNNPKLHKLAHQWLDLMPFTHRYFEVPAEHLICGDSRDYSWGLELSLHYANMLKVDVVPPVRSEPAAKCVHSVFKSTGKGNFASQHLHYMVDYAKQNNLSICGDASGILLASVFDKGNYTGYFKAWIPVK
jgi:DNA-binding transcriptional MerR regulator